MKARKSESRDVRSDVPDSDKKKDRRYPFSSEKRRWRDSDFLINSWLQRYRSSRTESKKSSQYLEKRYVGKPTTSLSIVHQLQLMKTDAWKLLLRLQILLRP